MNWLLVLTLVSLVVAVVALAVARRASRQVAQITELYWQLKYDHGEMKAKVFPPERAAPPQGFVPIGDVKKQGSRP